MIAFQFDGVPDAFRHRTALRRWLTTVAQREGRTIAQLTYVLLTDKALLTYNRQYRSTTSTRTSSRSIHALSW